LAGDRKKVQRGEVIRSYQLSAFSPQLAEELSGFGRFGPKRLLPAPPMA
jgi:hypothetical protein